MTTSVAPASIVKFRNRFAGERALVVFGGPSIIARGLDLGRLRGRGWVVFLESRTLTPRYLEYELDPDFFLMLYPEKCKANAFQGVVFQSFLAGVDLRDLVREELRPEVEYLRDHFDEYFEPWRPDVPHKRLRWKPDVYLKNSPFDLLSGLERTACLTFREPWERSVTRWGFPQAVYAYDMEEAREPFSTGVYYTPMADGERVVFRDFSFTNSAAIALFPLLRYLGFRMVAFVGMDMSMLGSMEYAAPYTFRSLQHFRRFFERARPVFSASFPRRFWVELYRQVRAQGLRGALCPLVWRPLLSPNPWYLRPYYEFDGLKRVLAADVMEFVNVYEPWPFARPVPGARNVTFEQLVGML